ncbi:MAG: PilT/PilU family type 4a pilus ATPase [Burkholderiales bacterium]
MEWKETAMFVTPLLKLMAEKQASDLFFSAGSPIQIKINGEAMPVSSQVLDADQVKRICYELMTEAQVKEFEASHEMNFAQSSGALGNFRISIFHQKNTVAMVIRYIQPEVPAIETLGLPPILKEIIMEKLGLILVVGATGSGKSTTMASMIDYRNGIRSGHILTIEDPIEFLFTNKKSVVNQREVGRDCESLQIALKNALRQAPDVILIGEIRDRETMEYAMQYAETGHLCLATLHANNSNQALDRIINFFPEERRTQLLMDLSLNLKGMISQRLIARRDGPGRVAAIEIMLNSPLISDLIFKGDVAEIKEIMKKSTQMGMQTFDQALFDLYEAGLISYEDAMRNADSMNELRLAIKLHGHEAKEKDMLTGLDHLNIV